MTRAGGLRQKPRGPLMGRGHIGGKPAMKENPHARRPGEIALGFDPGETAGPRLAPVGRIRSDWGPGDCPKNLAQARAAGGGNAGLEIAAPYRPGLDGLETGQAVWLLYWMDRGRRDLIVQAPHHRPAPCGSFALRSPLRPNPVAMALVRITGLEPDQGLIRLDAIDAFDGTPLLDIKPWIETIDRPPPP